MDPSFKYRVDVLRVVDGDTVDVLVDLGFKVFTKIRVRLYGLNAPESRTRDQEEKVRGLAAKARLIELLDQYAKDLVLESHGVGKFGRCLGVFWSKESNINQGLLDEGHAIEYFGGKR